VYANEARVSFRVKYWYRGGGARTDGAYEGPVLRGSDSVLLLPSGHCSVARLYWLARGNLSAHILCSNDLKHHRPALFRPPSISALAQANAEALRCSNESTERLSPRCITLGIVFNSLDWASSASQASLWCRIS
jgi:hypothetical protein